MLSHQGTTYHMTYRTSQAQGPPELKEKNTCTQKHIK